MPIDIYLGSAQIKAAFFDRHGGVSLGCYKSLNTGFSVGDNSPHVIENRRHVAAYFDKELKDLIYLHQVHSSHIIDVSSDKALPQAPQGDASITNEKGYILAIQTADCLPILCADPHNHIIAAIHAGWRGAFNDIIGKTIDAMCQKGADIDHIHAAIGPAIHQASYEVDLPFKQRFLKKSADNEQFFIPSHRKNQFLFDLPSFGASCLAQKGVKHIQASLWDTFKQHQRFFSHRYATLKQQPHTGRLTAAILLET